MRGHIREICTKYNDGHMEKPTRADTTGGSTKNSGWVEGSYWLGEANKNNIIEIYYYVRNIGPPHTIYSTINLDLRIQEHLSHTSRQKTPMEIHINDVTQFLFHQHEAILPSNTKCTILLSHLTAKVREANLLPGPSQIYLISTRKLCDVGFKEIFD